MPRARSDGRKKNRARVGKRCERERERRGKKRRKAARVHLYFLVLFLFHLCEESVLCEQIESRRPLNA